MKNALLALAIAGAGARPVAAAPGPELTAVDLSDSFVPRVLRPDPDQTLDYSDRYRALAGESSLELWGVFPTFGVLAARLADEDRHACHAAVDGAALAAYAAPIARDDRTPAAERDRPERRAAIGELQEHLVCAGLLAAGGADRRFGRQTEQAVALYRRRHMAAAAGRVDAELRVLLATDSRELDFRAVLRALRERVVDATGLLEDGSARGERGLVLGRAIDPVSIVDTAGHSPLAAGAPDLVSPAVDAAARALGWLDPASAQAGIEGMRRAGVETAWLRLPPVPRYHGPAMELRAEIDRGDVWYDDPQGAGGRRRAQPYERRPALTLYARDGAGEVALVRWPTTIGTWQREKLGGRVVRRYKSSPTGRFVWREIFAAPAWFPPPSTPDQELVRRGP
ncbi:MAG TPA: peptidoglycan-binding protein, partial [Kofleriaceae bacterium]|nr:peptidoglycan-binding protein [Kofleriaceae bacterium]